MYEHFYSLQSGEEVVLLLFAAGCKVPSANIATTCWRNSCIVPPLCTAGLLLAPGFGTCLVQPAVWLRPPRLSQGTPDVK